MRIVYHLGLHCTDEERLLRCLQQNVDMLADAGIAVPAPALYRTLLRDTAVTLKGAKTSPEAQSMVIAQILEGEPAERVILSWDNFLAYPQWVLRGALYPAAGERLRALADIFPDHTAEAHLAIRNPVTYLPALLQKQRGRSSAEFMEGSDPAALRWSDTIRAMREAAPDVALTVWCDEDTPLIWPEVLAAVSGHPQADEFEGADELLAQIMSPTGTKRMQAFLAEHPADGPARRRRVVSAFLEKFGLPERLEFEFEMPGWTPDLIDAMTRAYDEDVARIRAMPGVTFLAS
ncbi:hypothetical protein SAMN05878503_101137 [Cereibacter ovatus]|uniref:Sulfotransferase family protein n=1 Tax=Cereibacter ovatus TaxID=439529 RepID=A0A285CIS5_9RHOB|nr:hypothetical protein [Cereibacter ovatus]SNX67502.1 hypothetical protein SAMN05878503_101137 [Cereibacter ovatus]